MLFLQTNVSDLLDLLGSRIHLLLVASSAPSCNRIDTDGTQVRIVPDRVVTVPELHIKLEAPELADLLIKIKTEHKASSLQGDQRRCPQARDPIGP